MLKKNGSWMGKFFDDLVGFFDDGIANFICCCWFPNRCDNLMFFPETFMVRRLFPKSSRHLKL